MNRQKQKQKIDLRSIPEYCPKCDSKLEIINALNTKAKCVIVHCKNCSWVREFKKCSCCGELVCI